jgi:hypothetical protein
VRILANCRTAMNDGGRILLCESLLPETRNTLHPSALMDLEMLVMAPGARQRTVEEYGGLFHRAGLRLSDVFTDGGPFSLVEARSAVQPAGRSGRGRGRSLRR